MFPEGAEIQVFPGKHSSIMNTLYLQPTGNALACCMISLILSTPLCDAASTSIGSPMLLLSMFAIILADVVFPVPAGPIRRKLRFSSSSDSQMCLSISTTTDCSVTSSKD